MYRITFCIAVMLFLPLLTGISLAESPPPSPAGGGWLSLYGKQGGFYYAGDTDDAFDGALYDGMTIEFWVYAPRLTEKDEWWNFISKPGDINDDGYVKPIYQIQMQYYRDRNDIDCTYLTFKIQGGGASIEPMVAPYKPEWRHVALQVQLLTQTRYVRQVFVDGLLSSTGWGDSENSPLIEDSDFPLYVGGLPAKATTMIHHGDVFGEGRDTFEPVGGFDGSLDEMRISDVFRYEAIWGKQNKVRKRFTPDKHTIALWHFDEGPGKFSYKDASRNGHTLRRGGALSVSRNRLPVTWGTLKR